MSEITILTGDARTLIHEIPDESVDLIFTDPLYAKEHLPLYEWLEMVAERVLKPTGFVLVYSEKTARYLIECFTHPGDVVLDPFVGGGTTPFVCSRINRRFVGFEVDPSAAEIARKRVAGWQPAPVQLSFMDAEEIRKVEP